MRTPRDHEEIGDDTPIAGLYRVEAPRLRRYFRARFVSAEDAADLVQEAFARFVRVSAATAAVNPGAYLNRIARNLLFASGRKPRAPVLVPLDESAANDVAVAAEQAYGIEASQLMEAYQQAIDALPPRTREVFLLHRVEEFSYKDIAGHLGISVRTVEWHMTEALVRLRRALDQS